MAHQVSLTDDEYKLVFSRLGDRLRTAGTAEQNGYDRTLGWTHSCGSGESIARIVSGPQPEVNFASVGLTTRTRIPALSAEGMASGQSLDMTSHHNNRSIE